jgi:hypothetical protein
MSASIDSIRGQARDILQRASQDEEFLTQLRSNPNDTLVSAGFAPDGIVDFGLEIGNGDDVTGYGLLCDRWTCIVTWCGYIPLTNHYVP